MVNSFIVFLAFLGFLLFGYVSMLRILVKREFGRFSTASLISGMKDARTLSSLGSSAFFVSMPATSLLLFWGWGPALLWLIIFHMFVESVFHLQYTTTEQDYSLAELLVRSGTRRFSLLESAMVQSFFILLMATVVTLLASMIDKQSGLLFALIALFPAQQLMRGSNVSVPTAIKLFSAAAVIGLGVVLAHKLGFAVYGDWAPFADLYSPLDWLRINNVTLIAGLLIIASFLLAGKTEFQRDVATFSGGVIVLLIIAMQIQLAWLQPVLDAPMNAVSEGSSESLPMFISLCMFAFAGMGALLIRLLNDETNYDDTRTSAWCFGRLQVESLIQLLFLILLVLSLASAMGIGAWKTHFTTWTSEQSFVEHLNLAINSTLQLVHSSVKIGTFSHTVIMVGMCIAGVSFLMMCVSRFKITRHDRDSDQSVVDVAVSAKVPQACVIFILSSYFIQTGITVTVWLIVGMLSWALIVHLMIAITRDMDEPNLARVIYTGICFVLLIIGALQISWLSVGWTLQTRYVPAGIGAAILTTGLALWWGSLSQLLKNFSNGSDNELFDAE